SAYQKPERGGRLHANPWPMPTVSALEDPVATVGPCFDRPDPDQNRAVLPQTSCAFQPVFQA
ncbi:MAG: hypothetical protein ABI127_06825, partial [Dokdonella sp.]